MHKLGQVMKVFADYVAHYKSLAYPMRLTTEQVCRLTNSLIMDVVLSVWAKHYAMQSKAMKCIEFVIIVVVCKFNGSSSL